MSCSLVVMLLCCFFDATVPACMMKPALAILQTRFCV